MKDKCLLTIIVLTASIAGPLSLVAGKDYSPFPNPDAGYVTDIADVLKPGQEEVLESWLYTTEKRTGVEIVVLTINSIKDYPGTPNNSIESFTTGLFNAYGIGNMPKNNGVLLLVAIKDRKARIELGAAYARDRDSDARKIMDKKILPYFRNDQYDKGIQNGVRAIISEFSGMTIIPGWVKIAVVIAIPILVLVTVSLFRNGKRGWGWICVGLIIVLLLALIRLLKTTIPGWVKIAVAIAIPILILVTVSLFPNVKRDWGWICVGLIIVLPLAIIRLGASAEALPRGSSAGGFGGGFGGGFSGGGGATGGW